MLTAAFQFMHLRSLYHSVLRQEVRNAPVKLRNKRSLVS